MIFDAHTWIGHWPFQPLPKTSAADLLREMDRHRIDKALVGSLHALFYKDAHEANRELAREIQRHRDRLIPCAILNPKYYGWQQDLKQCREEFGAPVLRFTPAYHGYTLRDPCALEMAEAAHGMKMTLSLFGRIVDSRGRHPLDPGREANEEEVVKFLEKLPKATFLLQNFVTMPGGKKWRKPSCYMDITRLVIMASWVSDAAKKYGAEKLVFGTSLLLRYAKPAFLGLEIAGLTRAQREKILWKNLATIVPEMCG